MKFDSATRERSYGGKAGIWLKKRRPKVFGISENQITAGSNLPSRCRSITPVLGSTEEAKCTAKEKGVRIQAKVAVTAENISIGWDDVLCRPIYKSNLNASVPSSTGKDGMVTNESHVTDDDHEQSDVDKEEEEMEPTKQQETRKRSRRGYGSRKREKVDLNGAEEPVEEGSMSNKFQISRDNRSLLRQTITSHDQDLVLSSKSVVEEFSETGNVLTKEKHSSALVVYSEDELSLTRSSPQPTTRESSICLALNSGFKGTTIPRRVTDYGGNKAAELPKMHLDEDDGAVKIVKERDRKTLIKLKEAAANPALEWKDENVRQPSSNTSVDAAKAFFQHLDATQELVLDGSKTPQRPGNACVRTKRTVDTCSTPLQQEYKEYVESTKEADVTPLPLREFAVNRSNYFRKSQVYEGFLDE